MWPAIKDSAKKVTSILKKDYTKDVAAPLTNTSNKFLKFHAFPNKVLEFIEKYAYEMFVLHIDRMCEQIVSRGFSFNNVKDPLKKKSTESLFDLQSMLADTACQSLVNKDTKHKILCNEKFLSISEVIKRKYLGDSSSTKDMLQWRRNNDCIHGERKFYAFCFDINSGAMPSTRQQLLGIVEVTKDCSTTKDDRKITRFVANITGDVNGEIEFDHRLVFSMPYGEYLSALLLGFENLVMMIVNTKNTLGSADYKIFKDEAGFLDKDHKDHDALIEGVQPFVDGETKSIILGSGLSLEINKGDSAQEIKKVNVDLGKDILSFLTSIPTSQLFGENVTGLNSSKEDDQMQKEEFLTSKARLDFLPILHTFCDLFELKGRENLDFISYFESMRVLSLVKEFDEDIVDDAIKYKIRESYYKMLNMHGTPPPIENRDDEGYKEVVNVKEGGGSC